MKKDAEIDRPEQALKVSGQIVRYHEEIHGYLARPKKKGAYPGIVMIHEWWGLNEYIKQVARELAAGGYSVLAVDLFEGQVTADGERAMKLVKSLRQDEATQNMRAAAEYLKIEQKAEKIVSLGWCFGGGQSLLLALSGEKMDGTIIYYGNLIVDKEQLEKISWPVLGIFGDRDEVVSVASVKEFEAALRSLHIENEIYLYPGVGHAFANPSNPKHAPQETADAWSKTLAFLSRNLKNRKIVKVKIK